MGDNENVSKDKSECGFPAWKADRWKHPECFPLFLCFVPQRNLKRKKGR